MLNIKQYEAVNSPYDKPTLVLAGAGTGKTTVIAHRVLHLCKDLGLSPSRIGAITFTRKAANELKERLSGLHSNLAVVKTGTFHSFAIDLMKVLKAAPIDTPLSRSKFTIMDSKDQKNFVKKIVETNGFSTSLFEDKKDAVSTCVRYINSRKEAMQRARDVPAGFYEKPVTTYCQSIYRIYEQKAFDQNLYDFTEIILRLYICLINDQPTRDYVSGMFSHLLVDEYQDTNPLQESFVRVLLNGSLSITAVGDDDQSIYGWRGAKSEFILSFPERYENSAVVTLEENYRSSQNILNAANNVIGNNDVRHKKELFSNIPETNAIELQECYNNWAEANYVAETILEDIENGVNASDIAVLFRSNFQTFALEIVFGQLGIPYKMTGGQNFFDREEIKAVLGYLKLMINPNDSTSLAVASSFPKRRIGAKLLTGIEYKAVTEGMTLVESLAESSSKGCKELNLVLRELCSMDESHSLSEIIEYAVHGSGIFDYFSSLKDSEKAEAKRENLQALVDNITRYPENTTVEEFLEHIMLSAEGNKKGDENNAVSFSTIHGVKGLEFPTVFMIGVSDGILPHKRSIEEGDISEERRLAYVAITRAKSKLRISNFNSDNRGLYFAPSVFIKEMKLAASIDAFDDDIAQDNVTLEW
jgi:DNA helicase-2/ATP-dependent DNA helicase PcrA